MIPNKPEGDVIDNLRLQDENAENAIIKSNTVAKWLCEKGIEATVLADDSGLEVCAIMANAISKTLPHAQA